MVKNRDELIQLIADNLNADVINDAFYLSEGKRLLAAIEGAGCVVVPVDATRQMINAFDDWNWSPECAGCIDTYTAMINASPYKDTKS